MHNSPAGGRGSAQRLLECKGAFATWIGLVAGCFGRGTGAGENHSNSLVLFKTRKGKVVGGDVALGAWARDVARMWGS